MLQRLLERLLRGGLRLPTRRRLSIMRLEGILLRRQAYGDGYTLAEQQGKPGSGHSGGLKQLFDSINTLRGICQATPAPQDSGSMSVGCGNLSISSPELDHVASTCRTLRNAFLSPMDGSSLLSHQRARSCQFMIRLSLLKLS